MFSRFWERKGKAQTVITPNYYQGNPQYVTHNYEGYVKHGYYKNELIYACIARTANSSAQVALQMTETKTGKIVESHPFLDMMQLPSEDVTQSQFLYSVLAFQKLAGNAYFEVEYKNRGTPHALHPLRPDWVRAVPSRKEKIAEYQYIIPGMRPIRLKKNQVLSFPLFDPLNRYQQLSPTQVAARVGDIDNSATDFIKMYFESGGMPPGYLKTKRRLMPGEPEKIRSDWAKNYGGWRNWSAPAVLDVDAEYHRTGFTFEELGFEFLDERNENRICMIYEVPPILINTTSGLKRSTYENYASARRSWWEDVLVPVYKSMLAVFQTKLLPLFDDSGRYTLSWDWTNVVALQEKANERWSRYLEAFKVGGITVNQLVTELGEDPIGPSGEVYLRPMTMIEVPAKQPKGNGNGKKLSHVMDESDGSLKLIPIPQFKNEGPPDRIVRNRRERAMRSKTEKYLEGLSERILKESQKYSKASEGQKSVFPSPAFWTSELTTLFNILLPVYQDSAIDAFEGAFEAIQIAQSVDFNLPNEAVREWAKSYSFEKISDINDSSAKMYQEIFANWLQEGLTLEDLRAKIGVIVGPARADNIAITEITRLFAEANIKAWDASGVVKGKEWQTAVDEDVCPICNPLQGKKADLMSGAFPGGYFSPPAHPRCRCWLKPVVKEE